MYSDYSCTNSCISGQINIVTNHASMESLFIQLSDYAYISISIFFYLITVFVVQGHIQYINILVWLCVCVCIYVCVYIYIYIYNA